MSAEWDKQKDCIVTFFNEPEDSGIDSDSKLLEDDGQLSVISNEEKQKEWLRLSQKNFEERMNKMEEERADCEATPLIPWQRSRDKSDNLFNLSPQDRLSPPLYEVELTASEEDEDTSVLELVIPVQSANKFKRLPKKVECTFFFKVVCCFRGR